jgi:hypothetical protein
MKLSFMGKILIKLTEENCIEEMVNFIIRLELDAFMA